MPITYSVQTLSYVHARATTYIIIAVVVLVLHSPGPEDVASQLAKSPGIGGWATVRQVELISEPHVSVLELMVRVQIQLLLFTSVFCFPLLEKFKLFLPDFKVVQLPDQ